MIHTFVPCPQILGLCACIHKQWKKKRKFIKSYFFLQVVLLLTWVQCRSAHINYMQVCPFFTNTPTQLHSIFRETLYFKFNNSPKIFTLFSYSVCNFYWSIKKDLVFSLSHTPTVSSCYLGWFLRYFSDKNWNVAIIMASGFQGAYFRILFHKCSYVFAVPQT
jgi:hypothetical protein